MYVHTNLRVKVYEQSLEGVNEDGSIELDQRPLRLVVWVKHIEADAIPAVGEGWALGVDMPLFRVGGVHFQPVDQVGDRYEPVVTIFAAFDETEYGEKWEPQLLERGYEVMSTEEIEAPAPERGQDHTDDEDATSVNFITPEMLQLIDSMGVEFGEKYGIALSCETLREAAEASIGTGNPCWLDDPHMSFIYGVLHGWGESELSVLGPRHGWNEADIAAMKLLRGIVFAEQSAWKSRVDAWLSAAPTKGD